jgi:hypothetical protein
MRFLRRCIGLWMPRAHRNVPEPQAVHQLANAALVQGHVEFVHNPFAQIDQTPAHHPIPLRVRASADPPGDRRLLRSRQLPRPTTTVRAVEQTGNPLSVIAVRPVPQRLTVHARLTRRNPATMALQNQRYRQHPTPRRRILRTTGLPPQIRRRQFQPRDQNRHRRLLNQRRRRITPLRAAHSHF